MSSPPALPWYASFLCAGLGACTAEVVTLPVDTAKVRLMLLNRGQGSPGVGGAPGAGARPSMLGMMRTITVEEGVPALYKGLWPAIHRQLLFASLRVGLYGQISAYFRKPGETTVPLGTKILSGLVSGAIGIAVATPTDLVKVRFQSEGRLAPGQAPRYKGVLDAYSSIVRAEGVRGLWTGLVPNMLRNSMINASELASYDTAKEALLSYGIEDSFPVHVASAAFAGLVATIVGNPIDVVKTRIMAAGRASSSGASAVAYTGVVDCVVRTMRAEGFGAFYQGFGPLFVRITGWNLVMFVSFEQLKRAWQQGMPA